MGGQRPPRLLARRSALLRIEVATQIITALGAGGWFPYTAPAL